MQMQIIVIIKFTILILFFDHLLKIYDKFVLYIFEEFLYLIKLISLKQNFCNISLTKIYFNSVLCIIFSITNNSKTIQ